MPHSLKSKIKNLRYKGLITDKDCERLCEALEQTTWVLVSKRLPEEDDTLKWLGKNCKDCGNEKCKKLGILPKGYDCALWQAESEDKG